jgi:osmotically-inducible protein OsmY
LFKLLPRAYAVGIFSQCCSLLRTLLYWNGAWDKIMEEFSFMEEAFQTDSSTKTDGSRVWGLLLTSQLVMPLFVVSLLIDGCDKQQTTKTTEPGHRTGQGSSRPSSSVFPDRQDNQIEQRAPKQPRNNSAAQRSLAEQQQAEEEAAGTPPSKSRADDNKHAESVTPVDQSGTEAALAITQRIRQALLREDLSFAAKNVLVITEADRVVLKGQVRSPAEAERVKGIAGSITTKRIEDVLEVTP